MTRFWFMTSLSVVLAACTMNGMTGSGAMESHFAEAEEELDRHHGAIMGAASMPDVIEEASMHDSSMGRAMDGMDGGMVGMMSHCSGGGMDQMHETMSEMRSEMHAHVGALETATDLGSAKESCESHVAEMREMFAGMRHALDETGCQMMRF